MTAHMKVRAQRVLGYYLFPPSLHLTGDQGTGYGDIAAHSGFNYSGSICSRTTDSGYSSDVPGGRGIDRSAGSS